jgi:hypothetical protein
MKSTLGAGFAGAKNIKTQNKKNRSGTMWS